MMYKKDILKKSAQMQNFASNVLPNSENSHMQEFLYKSHSKVFLKAALKVYFVIFLAIKETGAQDFFHNSSPSLVDCNRTF